MKSLIETVVLPANLCPDHKRSEYVLLGDVSDIEQGEKSILVPKSPWDSWLWRHFGSGAVFPAILVRCSKCDRVTVHRYPGFHHPHKGGEWITVPPTGWRSQVSFKWRDVTNAEKRTWNILSVYAGTGGFPWAWRSVSLYESGTYLSGDGIMYPNSKPFLEPTRRIWGAYCRRWSYWRFLRDLDVAYAEMGRLFPLAGEKIEGLLSAIADAQQGILKSKQFAGSPNLAATREKLEAAVRELGFVLPLLPEKPVQRRKSEESGKAKSPIAADSSLQTPYAQA